MEQILAGLASNALSEFHAGQQYNREVNLMRKQNELNKANALDAYRTQVEGMKMAGLSPAGAMNQAPTVPQASKGSVGMAENVEFDPTTMLLEAQAENLKAQTEKTEAEADKIKGVDTKNVEAETDLKTAQTLSEAEKPANIKMDTRKKGFEINKTWAESENAYAQKPNIEAQTDKIKAETGKIKVDTTRISQLNEQYKDQNKTLKKIGPQIAQEIIDSPAFEDFDESTKLYFKKVANNELALTVGGIDAVDKLIQSNDKVRSTDKENFNYTLTKKVLAQQIYGEGSNAIEALSKMPQLERQKAEKILEKFTSEIAAINADKTLKDDDHKLKEIEKVAKELENKIKAISPEGMATTGNGWEWLKSTARSYVEEPTKLLAPLGLLKVGGDYVRKMYDNRKYKHQIDDFVDEYNNKHPLKGKPSDGIQNMKFKRH